MSNRQIYATVSDLNNPSSSDPETLFRALEFASEYIRDQIGWFVPVSETRNFNGRGEARLYLPGGSPLLSVTSIVNDGTTLESTDYIKQPDGAHWPDGPYSWLEVDPDASNLSVWADEEAGVNIAALWGKYNRSQTTGTTVQDAPQSDSQTTLKVADGSKVSAGMTLLIGSEQELVTGFGSATDSTATLGAALSASEETCTFSDGTKVNKGEILKIGFEDIYLLDVDGNSGSLIRGYNKTTRAAHSISTAVYVYRTFNVERGVNGTTAAAHAQSTSISRYLVPRTIHTLTLEIATLALKKAETGFAGRTGSVELGTVFYNDIFPRYDIAEIKKSFYIPRAL